MATKPAASSSASQQEQEQIADSNAATATNATTTTTTNNNSNNNNNTEDDPQDASEPMSIDAEPEPQHQQQSQQQQQQQKQPHQSPDSKKQTSGGGSTIAASEQKRPMNAFLLFCKQQRSLVREKHPNLENREITRILGEWWSKLDKEQKSKYTDLARQHKQAFMEANPDFKWCKTTITPPHQTTATTAGSNSNHHHNHNNNNISTNNNYDEPGGYAAAAVNNNNNNHINNHHHFKSSIATQEQSPYLPSLGDLNQRHNHRQDDNSSIGRSTYASNNSSRQLEAPKPPKKRYLERNETVYSRNSNHNANATKNDTSIDVFGLYLSLDEGLIKSKKIDEVIEEVLLEKSNDSPAAGSNMCKDSSSTSNNHHHHWPPSIELRTKPSTTISMDTISSSSTGAKTTTTATSSSSSNSNGCDEEKPVDLSKKDEMCTFKNQNIIDITIDKAYSGASDKGTSRSSDAVGSVHGQFGPTTNRKINTEVT